MNRVDEDGLEIGQNLQTDQINLLNSSLISANSRDSVFKTKSQMRARRGFGRILQNNVSEVANYIVDGINNFEPNKSKHLSFSRYEITSSQNHGQSRDESKGSRLRNSQNISRLLAK